MNRVMQAELEELAGKVCKRAQKEIGLALATLDEKYGQAILNLKDHLCSRRCDYHPHHKLWVFPGLKCTTFGQRDLKEVNKRYLRVVIRGEWRE